MTGGQLSYAVVTPACDEAETLPRLAGSLAAQTLLPQVWVIAENGSTDDTPRVAAELAAASTWIVSAHVGGRRDAVRGAPVVRAFHKGLEALEPPPDVVVKLDADVSFEPDYFERLMQAFAEDPSLGIASGSAYEQTRDGAWHQQFGTGGSVWGASRAYRWDCLQDVLPLDEYMGWDGIDRVKANMHGWRTRTLLDLPFRHHRSEGEREGKRSRHWAARGDCFYYMGYRPWYVVLGALHHARREPAALAMITGHLGAALRRKRRCPDPSVRAYLRREQRLGTVLQRRREALGTAAPAPSG
jgi:biofilm PGA synthesis N-glycosyltransferase PgaC